MKKVAITGSEGLLAHDLIKVLAPHYKLLLIDRLDSCADRGHEYACFDLNDNDKLEPAILNSDISIVFHCAAYVNADTAEKEKDKAYKGNTLATARLAFACRKAGIPLVAISTDYVFDGSKGEPYCEFDTPKPLSVYGKSKIWAEQLAFQSGARVAFVRTAWLFGVGGKNFVSTIKNLCREKDRISVVDDQRGSPTYTVDLAEALALIGKGLIAGKPYEGIWHITNSGNCTWFEFAQEIKSQVGADTVIEPTTTEKFGRPGPRPKYSVLENLRWQIEGLPQRQHWKEALKKYLEQEES